MIVTWVSCVSHVMSHGAPSGLVTWVSYGLVMWCHMGIACSQHDVMLAAHDTHVTAMWHHMIIMCFNCHVLLACDNVNFCWQSHSQSHLGLCCSQRRFILKTLRVGACLLLHKNDCPLRFANGKTPEEIAVTCPHSSFVRQNCVLFHLRVGLESRAVHVSTT